MKVNGSVVVVTSGGNGIGPGLCERFANAGATVAVVDRDGDAAGEVARSTGARAWTVDVSVEA